MQKYNPLRIGTALIVLVLFIGMSIIPSTVGVDKSSMPTFVDPTIVSIQPPTQVVEKGESFAVSVYIEPGEPIIGVSVEYLYFDPALIHANWVSEGNLFEPWYWLFDYDSIDNVNGEITGMFGFTIPIVGVTDSGYLCNISFTAQQQIGTSYLDLEGVIVSNETGTPVPVIINDGLVDIPMDEDVNVDHIVHFLDLVAVSLRYSEVGSPGWIREDVDNNGEVHFLDLVQVSLHYNEVW